jgi:hypothetical protein
LVVVEILQFLAEIYVVDLKQMTKLAQVVELVGECDIELQIIETLSVQFSSRITREP